MSETTQHRSFGRIVLIALLVIVAFVAVGAVLYLLGGSTN